MRVDDMPEMLVETCRSPVVAQSEAAVQAKPVDAEIFPVL